MFEELVMWSDAPESIIHGVDLKRQDRAYNSLHVCATKTLGIPDTELDFSNARRCSIYSMVKELVSTLFAVGNARPGFSFSPVFPLQFVGFPWIFQQF